MPSDQRQVDLWYAFLDKIDEHALREECRAILPREEFEQEQRFTRAELRLQFLASRILLRTTLARYTGEAPRDLKFDHNPHGKPALFDAGRLPAAGARPPPQFSLSHTRGLVACAVATGHAVGLDVEDAGQTLPVDYLILARRLFASAEAACLEALPPDRRQAAFFELWTLKEAFIKGRGLGLSIPLDSFALEVASDRPPTISFLDEPAEPPEVWQFVGLPLAPRYQIGVAARLEASQRLSLLVREAPLLYRRDGS